MTRHDPQDLGPRLLYGRKEAARQLSISIRSLDYFLAAGRFKTRRIGKRVMIPRGELMRFAARDHWQSVDQLSETAMTIEQDARLKVLTRS